MSKIELEELNCIAQQYEEENEQVTHASTLET